MLLQYIVLKNRDPEKLEIFKKEVGEGVKGKTKRRPMQMGEKSGYMTGYILGSVQYGQELKNI